MARLLPARRRIMDPCRVADEVVVWLCQNEPKPCRAEEWLGCRGVDTGSSGLLLIARLK
jgi:hypothetical protein